MRLSEPFIRRPVATTLVMAALLLFGIAAYRSLPVSDLPNVDFPTLLVTAQLPGASPETMATSVATPLERQFSTIAGVSSMTSSSTLGGTQIVLQFDLNRDIDAAAQDVQAAISTVQGQLPPELPEPPSYRKVNPADQPILYLALTSPTLPLSEINEYGQTLLAQQISMVPGVAQVMVYGEQKFAVRVRLNPSALANRGIGIDEVADAIQQNNVNLPTGSLAGPRRNLTIESPGQLVDAAAFRPLVVAWRDGAPVRLDALGNVIDSVQNDETAAWFGDQRAVVLAVQRQPGTNTVAVSKAVREILPRFREQLPASVRLELMYDRAGPIRQSVLDVQLTLLATLVLVVLVIFLFLRNARATLIPSLALPFSIIGTFAAMYLLGFSLDNMSLLALTLSVGLVVDDAIVMLENVFRHLEMGKKPLQAALDGASEIGFTILSMTVSLVAVFIPILFMGGIIGRLFQEFAVTISVALLLSGFVSITLTPMLASRFLRSSHMGRQGRFYRASERAFDWMLGTYDRGLRWSLDHGRIVLLVAALVLVLTGALFVVVPKGFLPAEDQGRLFAFTEAQEGTSFEAMSGWQQDLNRIVLENPNVEAFISAVGSGPGGGTNTGILFVRLKDRSHRPGAEKVLEQLRARFDELPNIRAYPQIPPPIQLSGTLTRSQYQYTLQSTDARLLYDAAAQLEARLRGVQGLTDLSSDLRLNDPQVIVEVDRDQAASRGVTMAQVQRTLYDAYGSREVSTIYTDVDNYRVIVELAPEFQRDPGALSLLRVRSADGTLVPLDTIARLRAGVGPQSVNHAGQLPAVTLSFNLAPDAALGPVVAQVQAIAAATLPAGVSTRFQGAAEAFRTSQAGLGVLLLLAVLVIYLVLGILYESFVHPITILTALPFAGFGAVATLLLFGMELDVYGFVGVILLVGLVKKNGIMMVDFAIEAERAGRSPRDAIYDACRVRFRPILMTSFAAFMGAVPIALGLGAGAESRQPLGLAVLGGLLFSQTLTLFVTPVFYLFADRFQQWAGRRIARRRRRGMETPATT